MKKVWKVTALGATLVVALAVGGIFLRSPSATTATGSVDTAAGTDARTGGLFHRLFGGTDAAPAIVPHFVTGLEHLPRSLEGTEVDGELEVDARGHLKVTNGVRHVFDYFLSVLGEEPLAVIVARLHAYFADRLPPAAAAEADKLLADYLAYKQALVAIDAPTTSADHVDIDAVRARMAQVKDLRGQYLSPDASTAFYGDDDAYDQYSLGRYAVLQDKSLTPPQQAQQLAALEDTLPPSLQESMKTINQYNNLEQLTSDWQQSGGSPAELRQIRENLVGAAAADRLEALDAQRADWNARMNAWFAERAAILGNAGMSAQDRAQAVDAQRAQRFSSDEIVRVQALESIHDGAGATAMQGTPPGASG